MFGTFVYTFDLKIDPSRLKMFKKINHVGIAVKDLNRFINIFAGKLDLKLGKVEEVKKA